MEFGKYTTNGYDVIIIDGDKYSISNPSAWARRLCRRVFNVGANSFVILSKGKKADFAVRIFNPDGSEARTGGNKILCAYKFLQDNDQLKKDNVSFETKAGLYNVSKSQKNIKIDMGIPILERSDIPMKGSIGKVVNEPLTLHDKTINVTCLSMGIPHCVVFVDTFDFDQEAMGKEIEYHKAFPERINVNFVQVVNKKEIDMQDWERGVGVNLSCATGSCSALVACVLNNKTGRKITVHLLGGDIEVEWAEDNHLYLISNAENVFNGVLSKTNKP